MDRIDSTYEVLQHLVTTKMKWLQGALRASNGTQPMLILFTFETYLPRFARNIEYIERFFQLFQKLHNLLTNQ